MTLPSTCTVPESGPVALNVASVKLPPSITSVSLPLGGRLDLGDRGVGQCVGDQRGNDARREEQTALERLELWLAAEFGTGVSQTVTPEQAEIRAVPEH